MALDNNTSTRRPHSREEYEADRQATEDRIVKDSGMEEKLVQQASGSAKQPRNSAMHQPLPEAYARRANAGGAEEGLPRRPRRTASERHEEQPLGVLRMNSAAGADSEIEESLARKKSKKKGRIKRLIAMILVEALTLIAISVVGFAARYMSLVQDDIAFDKEKVQNSNIDISKQQEMATGYWTLVVFGVDSRDGSVGKGTNADVQIIVNIDRASGDVKMVSVYRDTYLNLGKNNRYAKINEAYADGGPEQAVLALNKNLDLNIENYVTFNWKAVADAITMLGGVDIDISDKEFYYMNAYIHEVCLKTGISKENPAAEYLKEKGYQHLDGVQAVAYARLRYMDNDFERTKRQREVITQCLARAKQTDLATLTKIIDTVLPQVAFNIDTGDIIQLAKGVAKYNIVDTQGFPTDLTTQMMGKKGDCVIPKDLASNVSKLHQFLFDDEDYKPSSAVYTYSNKIADDSSVYKTSKAAEETAAVKKTTAADDDDEKETDENGKVISSSKKSSESSKSAKDGTEDDTTESKDGKETKSTKESGDEKESTKEGSKETKESSKESTKANEVIADDPTESRSSAKESTGSKETTKSSETKKSETVEEPGKTETTKAVTKETTTQAVSPVSPGGATYEGPGGADAAADSGAGPGQIVD